MHFTNGTDVVARILNSTSPSHIIDTESTNTLICTHWSVIYVKKKCEYHELGVWFWEEGKKEKRLKYSCLPANKK